MTRFIRRLFAARPPAARPVLTTSLRVESLEGREAPAMIGGIAQAMKGIASGIGHYQRLPALSSIMGVNNQGNKINLSGLIGSLRR